MRFHKNNESYGAPIHINNTRTKIRSLPRRMSKKRQLRAHLNKSMANTKADFVDARGVILAMSRRKKLKSKLFKAILIIHLCFIGGHPKHNKTMYRNQNPIHFASNRSNSVSSHRRSRSTQRSHSKRRTEYRFYKSKTNLKGQKYLKNVLPVVSSNEGEMRNRIAQGFDSTGHNDL